MASAGANSDHDTFIFLSDRGDRKGGGICTYIKLEARNQRGTILEHISLFSKDATKGQRSIEC